MDYHEQQMWPFTSPTTCYSAGGFHPFETKVQWAIESHICSLDFTKDRPNVDSHLILTESDEIICVGYSVCNDWECLTLLDKSRLQVQPPSRTTGGTLPEVPSSAVEDDTTTIASTQTSFNDGSNPLRSSLSSEITSQVQIMGSVSSMDLLSTGNASETHGTPNPNVENRDICNLELQKNGSIYHSMSLNFRPLAPKVCEMKTKDGESTMLAVWLGSADNSKLYFYLPSEDNASFTEGPLDHEAFKFLSPVMAIEYHFCTAASRNCLAVACQDGTIRVITFEINHSSKLLDVKYTQVIVDGPITCCSLKDANDRIHLIAGSLCGYVLHLYVNLNDQEDDELDGPYLVTEGLRNDLMEIEDSVLALHASGDLVLLGTHSGRCLLYRNTSLGWVRQWECQLSYPIHAMRMHEKWMVVVTRFSVHLFKKRPYVWPRDPDLVLSHLKKLLEEREELLRKRAEAEQVELTTKADNSITVEKVGDDDGSPHSTKEDGSATQ